jgi:hypothetical protein
MVLRRIVGLRKKTLEEESPSNDIGHKNPKERSNFLRIENQGDKGQRTT